MVRYFTRGKERDEFKFKTLISFDGRSIEGDNFFTHLPISQKEYRDKKGSSLAFIQFWKGDTQTEFVVTDDWGEQHVLLIPNEMVAEIEAAKANIIASDIPSNIANVNLQSTS